MSLYIYNTGHRGRSSTIQAGHVRKAGQIKPAICFSQQTWCKGACILRLCIPHCNRKFLICTVYIHAHAFEPLSFGRLDVFWKRFHGGLLDTTNALSSLRFSKNQPNEDHKFTKDAKPACQCDCLMKKFKYLLHISTDSLVWNHQVDKWRWSQKFHMRCTWQHGDWSTCSSTCGVGLRQCLGCLMQLYIWWSSAVGNWKDLSNEESAYGI